MRSSSRIGASKLSAGLVVALGLVATPLGARDLAVPTGKGWQHAATGLILTAQIDGLPRTALSDATQTERDVSAQFETLDRSVFATVYIFRPVIADVALWFDRSRTALEARADFRSAAPASLAPIAFTAGGAPGASSLRQVYANAGGRYRSTALAIMPLGDWIVGVRMTAETLTADALDARLLQLIAALRWPKPTGATARPAPPAVPIVPCATPLAFTKAKPVKPAGADLLMALVGGMAAQQAAEKDKTPAPPRRWCREGEARVDYGVYRSEDDTAGYMLALYDAGRIVSVQPSLMEQIDKSGTVSITLTDVEGNVSTFPSFSALPQPKQVWELVRSGKRTGTSTDGGKQITIDPKAL